MTGQDVLRTLEEGDALDFGSISERCIYLYLRYHADRRGVVRLAMSELAAMLKVNRQTVLKHVEALVQRNLARRVSHGRYKVYAEPWTLQGEIHDYLLSLKPGQAVEVDPVSRSVWGIAFQELDDRTMDTLLDAFEPFKGKLFRARDSDNEWLRI